MFSKPRRIFSKITKLRTTYVLCIQHDTSSLSRDELVHDDTSVTTPNNMCLYTTTNSKYSTSFWPNLIAHNCVGLDTMITSSEEPTLGSATIIGIILGAIILFLILVDLTCYCVKRIGIIAMICNCGRSKRIDEEESRLGR